MAELKIVESFLTENPCYKLGNKMKQVKGLMLHSVGCSQPSAQVFVRKWNKASCTSKCVHGFIDLNTGIVYQTLPWNYAAWHCGASGNNTHIGVETCEPAQIKYTGGSNFTYNEKDLPAIQAAVKKGYDSAVKLFAQLCKAYSLDPLAKGVIVSHKEGHDQGIASGHADIDHLWKQTKVGFTMDQFRNDVAKTLYGMVDPEPEPTPSDPNDPTSTPVPSPDAKKYYRVRKSASDSKSQLGAFLEFSKAKTLCDSYPGYHVYDWEYKLVYPTQDVPFRFQVKKGETPLKIYKTPSTKATTWVAKVSAGVYTIVKIQNGSGSSKGFGLLKSYSDKSNGWVNLDTVTHIL